MHNKNARTSVLIHPQNVKNFMKSNNAKVHNLMQKRI